MHTTAPGWSFEQAQTRQLGPEMFFCSTVLLTAREETQLVVTITPSHLTRCSEMVAQGLVQLTFSMQRMGT